MALSQAQLFRILKNHYIEGYTQREIAKQEGLSTATISRAIREGIEKGYVTITLNLPTNSVPGLENSIQEKFGLDKVFVSHVNVDDHDVIMKDIAVAFAEHLDTVIKPGDIIGLSWGRTLAGVMPYLPNKEVENVAFIGMNGAVSSNIGNTSIEQVVRTFSQHFGAKGYWLPLPSYVSNSHLIDELKKDEPIESLFRIIEQANIAIFSVGGMLTSSLLYSSGYFTPEGYKDMKGKGYVGDICSRLYKADGTYDEADFKNISTGITLEELKQKQRKICIVADPEKASALQGALHGGYVDELFVDERTASALLQLEEIR